MCVGKLWLFVQFISGEVLADSLLEAFLLMEAAHSIVV